MSSYQRWMPRKYEKEWLILNYLPRKKMPSEKELSLILFLWSFFGWWCFQRSTDRFLGQWLYGVVRLLCQVELNQELCIFSDSFKRNAHNKAFGSSKFRLLLFPVENRMIATISFYIVMIQLFLINFLNFPYQERKIIFWGDYLYFIILFHCCIACLHDCTLNTLYEADSLFIKRTAFLVYL